LRTEYNKLKLIPQRLKTISFIHKHNTTEQLSEAYIISYFSFFLIPQHLPIRQLYH